MAIQSLVVACGVRKVWAKELKDCETTSQQISHLRRMLMELGMKSRFSMEQAKAIRKERELAKEIRAFASLRRSMPAKGEPLDQQSK